MKKCLIVFCAMMFLAVGPVCFAGGGGIDMGGGGSSIMVPFQAGGAINFVGIHEPYGIVGINAQGMIQGAYSQMEGGAGIEAGGGGRGGFVPGGGGEFIMINKTPEQCQSYVGGSYAASPNFSFETMQFGMQKSEGGFQMIKLESEPGVTHHQHPILIR